VLKTDGDRGYGDFAQDEFGIKLNQNRYWVWAYLVSTVPYRYPDAARPIVPVDASRSPPVTMGRPT
jgi:hypothetical protein